MTLFAESSVVKSSIAAGNNHIDRIARLEAGRIPASCRLDSGDDFLINQPSATLCFVELYVYAGNLSSANASSTQSASIVC